MTLSSVTAFGAEGYAQRDLEVDVDIELIRRDTHLRLDLHRAEHAVRNTSQDFCTRHAHRAQAHANRAAHRALERLARGAIELAAHALGEARERHADHGAAEIALVTFGRGTAAAFGEHLRVREQRFLDLAAERGARVPRQERAAQRARERLEATGTGFGHDDTEIVPGPTSTYELLRC